MLAIEVPQNNTYPCRFNGHHLRCDANGKAAACDGGMLPFSRPSSPTENWDGAERQAAGSPFGESV